jgi:hypothetical protein
MRTFRHLGLAICGLLVSFDVSAAVSTVDFNQEAGMQLARGYDSLSGEIKRDCITRTKPTPPADEGDSTASRVTFILTKIENYSSLARQIGVSASASMSGSVASISGSASFLDE